MATAAPDGTLQSSLSGLQGILDRIIGSKTVGTDQRSLTTQQNVSGTNETKGTEGTTGTVDTATQQLQQLLSQLTGTTNTTTKNTADVSALQKVFAQQQGGITPDMLAAIFREGSKAAPQLVATTANAIGARPGDNSALAASLTDLNSSLVSQAASLNQQMLRDSAGTAGQIAQATGGQQVTGQTSQSNNQSVNTSGTTSQEQNIQKILQQLQTQNTNTNTNQQLRDDTTSATGINTRQTGLAAGLAGLISLFGSDAGQAALKQGGTAFTDLLKGIPGLGGGGSDAGGTGLFEPILGSGDYPLPPGVGGYAPNPYMPSDPKVSFDDPISGFADGGVVGDSKPKMLDINAPIKSGAPNVAQLLSLLGGQSGGVSMQALLGGGSGEGGSAAVGSTEGSDSSGVGANSGGGSSTSVSAPSANDGFSSPVGMSMNSPTAGQAVSLASAVAMGNPFGIAAALASLIGNNFSLNSNQSTINAPADVDLGPADPNAVSSMDTIGVEGLVGASDLGPDAAAIGVADSDAGANGSVGDGDGDSGDGGGDGSGDGGDGGGDGGWADGGVIPKSKKDPKGTGDGLTIKVSGGEGILPTDVTEAVGEDFIHSLIALFHKPAATQST